MHFRGPIQIKQFAAYAPVNPTAIKRDHSSAYIRRHGHHHQASHKRENVHGGVHGKEKRQEVIATIDGKLASWENNWFGPAAATPTTILTSSTSSVRWVTATIDGQVVSWVNNWSGPPATPTGSNTPPANMVTATIDGVVVSVRRRYDEHNWSNSNRAIANFSIL